MSLINWNDSQLTYIISISNTLKEVMQKLRAEGKVSSYSVRNYIKKNHLNISHFGKVKCFMCNKLIKICNIERHKISHNKIIQIKEKYEKDKEFSHNKKRHVAWNKGLTKETNFIVKQYGLSQKGKHNNSKGKTYEEMHGKERALELKNKISLGISKNHNGGYKKVPYIEYTRLDNSIIKLRGTYEIKFAKFLDKNKIEWIYQKPIQYIDNEVKRHLLPDFYLPLYNKYFDTKGYFPEDSKRKLKLVEDQTNIKINLVFKKDLSNLEEYFRPLVQRQNSSLISCKL